MSLDNILNCNNKEETIAFLSYLIPFLPMELFDNKKIKLYEKFKNLDYVIPNGPETYLDIECIEVAKLLNSKNIFSITSLKTDKNIFLFLDKLDNENMKILKEKQRENPNNYFLKFENKDYIGISIEYDSNNVELNSKLFMNLVNDFKIQDIQRGYYNEKNFLMNICNCERVDGLKEFKASNAKIVFDINKMDKSFRDYLKEAGYEKYYFQEEHRVYLNDFYYNAHKNYLESKNLAFFG